MSFSQVKGRQVPTLTLYIHMRSRSFSEGPRPDSALADDSAALRDVQSAQQNRPGQHRTPGLCVSLRPLQPWDRPAPTLPTLSREAVLTACQGPVLASGLPAPALA